MNPFSARLINEPFSDPGAYLEFRHRGQALLFDLGDLHALSPRQVLKVDHIFVSHTHMDHFIGFDQMIRICLGRNRRIALFGPAGFVQHVENRLQSYTWNLVGQYTNDFILDVTEVFPGHRLRTARFQCRTGFSRETMFEDSDSRDILTENDLFSVQAAHLDHKIASLGFCLEERQRLNIKKNVLQEMGLPTGAWLNELKEHILRGEPDRTPIRASWKNEEGRITERLIPLGVLKDMVVKETAGDRIAYVTDVIFSTENIRKIVALAAGAEILFIEATFLDEDHHRAADTYHLTARQAGTIARMAGVKRMIPFHFSPKYRGREKELVQEAKDAFQGE